MKTIFFLLLGCLCLQTLNAQKIQLHEGDEFTYRSSLYNFVNSVDDDGFKRESVHIYQIHFKVIESENDKYRLTAQYEIVNDNARTKNSGHEQWKTNHYYDIALRDSNTLSPGPEYQADFTLSNTGNISNINIISSTTDKNVPTNNQDIYSDENLFRKIVERLFDPLLEKINNDENIKEKYSIKSIQDNQIVLNIDKGDSYKPQSIYDTETGLLLEKNILQQNLGVDYNFGNSQSNGNYEIKKEKSDILMLWRINLIKTNKEPYFCTFSINENDMDTTFSNTNVTIWGKIIHPNQNREVSIEWYETIPYSYNIYAIKTKLKDDNTFEIRLNIDDLKKVKFKHQETIDFYLTPGDDIFITMDMENPENAEATGVGSNNINYCFKKYVFEKSENLSKHDINNQIRVKSVESTPDEFKKYFFEVMDKKQQFLKDNKKWIDPQLYLAEFWNNRIELVKILNNYPNKQKFYRHEAGKEPYEINRSDFLDDQIYSLFHPDNDMMACADEYDYFMLTYTYFILDNKMKELTGRGNTVNTINSIDQHYNSRYGLSGSLYSGYSQYVLKYQTVVEALNLASWDVFKNLYNQFLTEYPKTNKARILKEAYAKVENLVPGKTAFNFELPDFDGNKVKLSDFKGKVLFLSFLEVKRESYYYSWFRDISNQLQEKFKDKDIVFVYIFLDQNFEHSKEFVNKLNIGGEKLIALNREDELLLREKYFFDGTPHYCIIDKEGKIYQRHISNPFRIVNEPSILLDALEPH